MAEAGHNSIDPVLAKRFLEEVRRTYEDEETERASWRGKAAAIKQRRADVYERADGSGIPAKLLKARIKQWIEDKRIAEAKARRAAAVPDDEDDRADFEALCAALGEFADTPLGAAAVDAARPEDEDADLRPRFLQESDAERQTRENAERLKAGITGLPGADATAA